MISIQGNRLYDEHGYFLKELSCPIKISMSDLERPERQTSQCRHCERAVINTDYMSEHQLVELLQKHPETCIKINRLNPIFVIADED